MTKADLILVHNIKQSIQDLELEQDTIYANLLEDVGVVKGTRADDILFDYIYNDSYHLLGELCP